MNVRILKNISVILIFIFLFNACSEKEQSEKLTVFVGILPQKYFVEKIAGDKIEVYSLVGPGQNPHSYEPLPAQMMALSRAKVYFEIGLPFEEILIGKIKSSNPGIRIIDTSDGVTLRKNDPPLSDSGFNKELHADHDEHGHGEYDPHIWLSPDLVKIQAAAMFETLSEMNPENKEFYLNNLKNFIVEIDSLKSVISKSLSELKTRKLLVFHPAFGYFADSFGLEQIPVEAEGKEPGPRQLTAIEDFVKKEKIDVIFVQAQFSPQSAEALASELDCSVVTLDPLAGNWPENMMIIAETIKEKVR